MMDDQEPNLVNIYTQIGRFKSSLVRRIKAFFRLQPALDKIDEEELQEIRTRIELIEINQSFIAHQPEHDEKVLTQEDLLACSKAIQLGKLRYTHQQTQQLYNDITNEEKGIYYRIAQKYPQLFKKIIPILKKMIEALEQGRKKTRDDTLILSDEEEKNFQAERERTSSVYKIANMVDCGYHLFSQKFDPLALTNSKGSCYGYVATWAEQIEAKNSTTNFLHFNHNVSFKQVNESHFRTKEKEIASFSVSYGTAMSVVDELLEKLNENAVYGIDLDSHAIAHRVGLRRIPSLNKDEIEFYDPNFGVFIFKNIDAFKIWFPEWLSVYRLEKSFSLQLNEIAKQPAISSSFVPTVVPKEIKSDINAFCLPVVESDDSSNTFKEKLIIFSNNIRAMGIGTLQQKINITDSAMEEKFNCQQDAYKNYLLENFFNNEKDLKISGHIKDQPEQKQPTLKEQSCNYIDDYIKKCDSDNSKQFLTILKEEIRKAPPTVSLEMLISHALAEKQPGKDNTWEKTLSAADKIFIANFSKNFEISPYFLTLLQEKLLFEIAAFTTAPAQVKKAKEINEVIKKYLKGESALTDTLSQIQTTVNKMQSGFFAKHFSSDAYAYSQISKIDPKNPQSLIQAYSRLSRFSSDQKPLQRPASTRHLKT